MHWSLILLLVCDAVLVACLFCLLQAGWKLRKLRVEIRQIQKEIQAVIDHLNPPKP